MNEILKRSNEKIFKLHGKHSSKNQKNLKIQVHSINSKGISKLLANFVLLKDYYESIVPNIKICEKLHSHIKYNVIAV